MSRCFPFPPPGYERKARPDDVDLLKKEKHKEKKHKTENKDKEKREEKEKREKDRSHEKHREKKDKKEKHRDRERDKKKDKDKNKAKAKEKINASDKKKNSGKTESHGGGNVVPKDGKDKNNGVHKRFSGPLAGYKTEKINQGSQLDEESMDSKLVQELDRRIKDDAGGSGSQIENCIPSVRTKDEGMVRLVATDNEVGIRGETSVRANATVDASDGTTRPFDKNAFRKVGRKEKEVDDKCGENRKERDKEKKSHGKDKVRDKEEEKIQVKSKEPDKIRENNKNHINCFHPTKTFQLPMDSNRSGSTDGNLKKRKDLETNGVLRANDFRPRKLPRHAPSSPMENGRKLESCQTSIFHALDEQGAANNLKVGRKECERNGIVEAPQSSFTPMTLKSPETRADSANASTRPPHPDSKYLSQIYSVPKIEECSEFDDQEWLFGSNESELKKSNTEALRVGTPQVWAEALQIGSADVCALPYVIPY